MNKIVREHYPVEKLPEDLQQNFAKDALVTIQLQLEEPEAQFAPPATRPMTGAETVAMIRELHGNRPTGGRTMEEIVKEVRELRDEWED